jgi:EEF1A N-terminal glycine/lysine methyltransferase
MLTSRIHIRPPSDPEPEDIFQSSLHALFLDDSQSSHGNPGDTLIYRSPRYGEIKINLPAHPDHDAGRRLFAHYLWNASVLVADMIEEASQPTSGSLIDCGSPDLDQGYWDVRGERILELGAGR